MFDFKAIQEEQYKIFVQKQFDYGAGNINRFGDQGILVRSSDKLERLINLYKNNATPANESINNTWLDISIYAIIALLFREGNWPK